MWWIDYVLRNPDISFLKNPMLAKQNVFVKHSMDVIAFLLVLVTTFLLLVCKAVIFMVQRMRRRRRGHAGIVKLKDKSQ